MGSGLKLAVSHSNIAEFNANAIIIGAYDSWKESSSDSLNAVDAKLDGALKREMEASRFTGAVGKTFLIHTLGKLPARYVIITGLGKADKITAADIRRASAAGVRSAQSLQLESIASELFQASQSNLSDITIARIQAEGARLAPYKFMLRKSKPKQEGDKKDDSKEPQPETWTLITPNSDKTESFEKSVKLGKTIAKHVNLVRDWVNDSANYVTPTFLKEQAEGIKGLKCETLNFKDIQKKGMGLFETVAKGSDEPSFLLHLSYKPANAKKKIALVGKGLTFDSGGLSLKPAKSMETMKMDMAGAAVVLSVMRAISKLDEAGYKLDVQVDGFIGTCENMPNGGACKPGDIAVSLNGKTVEINNTDAEGRLVLADVLTYAQEKTDPDIIIDLATLTGACIVALGTIASGVMGTDDALIGQIIESGKTAGEKFWQLPLYEEYRKALDSDVADLINANSQGEAGSQNGGMFLKEFVDEKRSWAHLDIAGPAMISKDFPETPKGATGFAVRTLLYYLYNGFE